MLVTIIELLTVVASVGIALHKILTPAGRSKVTDFLKNVYLGTISLLQPVVDEAVTQVRPLVLHLAQLIENDGAPIVEDLKVPFANLARKAFTTVASGLEAKRNITPAQWSQNAGDAMADAFGFGLASFGVSAAFEAIFPEKLNTLNGMGPMLATMAGFDEVTKAALRPLLETTITTPGLYDALSKTRPVKPDFGVLMQLYARRLITHGSFTDDMQWTGLTDGWISLLADSSFRPLQAGILRAAFDDTQVDPAPFKAALQYAGFRDPDITLMLDALQRASLKSLRHSIVTSAIDNYVAGVDNDSELANSLNSLNLNDEAKRLYVIDASIKRLKHLTEEYKKGWDDRIRAGNITVSQYHTALAALGYDDPLLAAYTAEAQAIVDSAAFKKAESEADRIAATEQRVAVQAAMTAYRNGEIDAIALTAALTLAKLPLVEVALYVGLAKARGLTAAAKKAAAAAH